MKTCPRCTTSVLYDAPVCTGCCLTFEAQAAPVPATPIEAAFVPAGTHAPDNPWRQPDAEPVYPDHAYPAEPHVEAPTAVYEIPAEQAAYEAATWEEPAAPAAPAHVPVELATQAPPSGIPILMSDPLPPIAAPVAAEYVPVAMVSDEPSIPVAHSDEEATARGLGLPPEETLAVPAAYASFAPEPMSVDTTEAPADVVELLPAGGLTIAPPAVHVPGWPEQEAQTASL